MMGAEQRCLESAKLYDGIGWTKYNGTGRPVPFGTLIDARYRNGGVILGVKVKRFWGMAQSCHWKHDRYGWEIVEYRIAD